MHGYACSRLGPGRRAEDVTAEVFIWAWRARAQGPASGRSLATWLLDLTRLQVAEVMRAEAVASGAGPE